jgi:hypothetical protein
VLHERTGVAVNIALLAGDSSGGIHVGEVGDGMIYVGVGVPNGDVGEGIMCVGVGVPNGDVGEGIRNIRVGDSALDLVRVG